jgi:hypothetical protein
VLGDHAKAIEMASGIAGRVALVETIVPAVDYQAISHGAEKIAR